MKKNYLYILLTLVMLFVFTPSVLASSTFKMGGTINEEGDLTDSAYYLGSNITSKVNTTDTIYALGNAITLEGNSEYIFAIGSSVSLKGTVVKNIYAVGSDVTVESSVGKDLFVAGKTVKIDGPVNGDLYVSGSDIVINNTINGNVYVAAQTIKLTSDATIKGKILYNSNVKLEKDDNSKIGSTDTYIVNTNAYSLFSAFNSTMFSYLNILVLGLLILYYFPKLYKRIDKETDENNAKEIFKSIVDGLLGIIIVPIVAFILMIFQFGIATGVLMLILSAIIMYLSTLITGWVFANYLRSLKITKEDNKYFAYAIALFIIYLLRLVPVLGICVVILSVLYGYGIFMHMVIKKS